MKRVSVIIPTFNRAGTLGRAIESVLAQHYAVAEIIVVDDCSTDGTRDVATGFGDRITYLVNARNLGSQGSRNRGLGVATGEVFAFLDSDDYWRHDKIRLQMELADTAAGGSDYCVTCGYRQFGAEPGPSFIPPREIRLAAAMVHNVIGPTSNILISRSLLEAVGPFDLSMPSCQDWELFVRILERVAILGVPDILTFQDTGSSARISNDRSKVIAGHQAVYHRTRATNGFKSLPLGNQLMVRARQEIAQLRR